VTANRTNSGDREGRLTLVGTPIGNLGDISPRAVEVLRDADVVACEDTRRTRALLSAIGVPGGSRLRALHAHNEAEGAARVVADVADGRRVAYVTDAGMPGISDPGAEVVRACLEAGLVVDTVPGPTALTVALVLSGLPTDRFVFEGFLPRKGTDRRGRLEALATEPRTAVLYESPRRVAATLTDLEVGCGSDRPVAVLRELTKLHEEAYRGTLGEAARIAAAAESRGEHVIVLGGAATGSVSDATVTYAVRDALERGASARDAATSVAAELGIPRRRAYDVALILRKS
jgi:16S rRNA (cytidine1402-2'-O)-methyltransferase